AIQSDQSTELIVRKWRDNTGLYEVEGQLSSIFDGKVRLLKSNGRSCTVAFRRLSKTDMEYVQQVALSMGQSIVDQLASR
ncbi:MAG: SHD1 domain-containing protein, partial [Pirellulaceae bacterium]|nr:SHD1 domain-containing protein [Pirellulaceae bacterium]